MCGITGIYLGESELYPKPAQLSRMTEALRHRGPDDEGSVCFGPYGLGHTRLAIIDPGGGKQPMRGRDGCTLVFNGEIFNHVELRKGLEAKGHRFRTHSDTEVLLAALIEHGPDCLPMLRGPFAFAFLEPRKRRLLLARDACGIRPLYFAPAKSGGLVFASEISSLLASRQVEARLDPLGLDDCFSFWSPLAPRSILSGVEQLPAGELLLLEKGKIQRRSWTLPVESSGEPIQDPQKAKEELEARLLEATRLRLLRSDVPVGAYLSGGLDSTLLCGLVSKTNEGVLDSFSIRFEDEEFDESSFQNEASGFLNVRHRSLIASKDEICRVFPDVLRRAEAPLLRSAPAPLFLLSAFARSEGYKVVLTGEGADEFLGGYDLYKEAKIRRFCAQQPDSAWRHLLLRRLYPWMPRMQLQSDAYRKAFFSLREDELSSPLFSHLPRFQLTGKIREYYAPEFQEQLAGRDPCDDLLAQLPEDLRNADPLRQAIDIETKTLLSGYLLSSQGDRMSMAHGVEGRYPYLDPEVIAFSRRLHPRLLMRGLTEKYLLRELAKGYVPESIRLRNKQPYRAPDATSFFDPESGKARAPWVGEILSSEHTLHCGIFDRKRVARLVEKARTGRVKGQRDHMALLGILSTQWLCQRFGVTAP